MAGGGELLIAAKDTTFASRPIDNEIYLKFPNLYGDMNLKVPPMTGKFYQNRIRIFSAKKGKLDKNLIESLS